MTYRAGTNGLGAIGIPDGDPRIVCDGCGDTYAIARRGAAGAPPAWFLDGKAPPKWRTARLGADANTVRRDYCPACKRKGGDDA